MMNGTSVHSAMLMAAGLGKRMRPLTATRPKPLVRVDGKPLLDHALERLEAGGIKKAVVNVHYLPDALIAHVKARRSPMEILISDEREKLLETGGGLVKALPMLGDEPFICANSDNIWIDGPQNSIAMLSSHWDDEKMDALLLLVPHARAHCHKGPGDFHMDDLGRITRRRSGRLAPFVFTGVQLVSPRLLRNPPEGAFSTNFFWSRAIEEGRLYGVSHEGLWFDIGSPGAIPRAEAIIAGG